MLLGGIIRGTVDIIVFKRAFGVIRCNCFQRGCNLKTAVERNGLKFETRWYLY